MFYIVALVSFIIDQASKYYVIKSMFLGQSIPVVAGFFHITHVHNTGAAFGLMPDRTGLFIVVSSLVVAGITIYQKKCGVKRGLIPVSLGLIVGGTVGNLVDRMMFGAVIDFIDFRVWPVFNLADSAIVAGAILLTLALWKAGDRA
ncbi:MAG: signal peptidase II [Bacillota bacterium]